MNLLLTLPFFHPATRFGGPVAQLRLLCPELARLGHRVRVITTDNGLQDHPDIPRNAWIPLDGYQVYYAATRPLHRIAPYRSPGIRPALRQTLPDTDIVHAQLGLTLFNAAIRRECRRAGMPYVYAARGSLCPDRLRERRHTKALFLRLIERRILRDAAALHALTEKERRDYLAQGADPARIHVIPNGIDPIPVDQLPDPAPFRERFDLPADRPVVLFLGQLIPIKGIDLLIAASARVMPDHPHTLVLAGPDAGHGPTARRLAAEAGIADHVIFTGHLHAEEKYQALRACDLFALTSYSEGLPNTPLEAAMCQRPVLITDACHLPEVAEHNAGRITPPAIDPIATALADLLAHPAQRQAMGQNARRMIEHHFNIHQTATALVNLYQTAARH